MTTDKFLNIIVEPSWIDLINQNGRRLNTFFKINTKAYRSMELLICLCFIDTLIFIVCCCVVTLQVRNLG